MLERAYKKFLYITEAVVVAVITLIIFIYVIQPILVNIHPMFALKHQLPSGRYPDTPAGLAYFLITIPTYFIYRMNKKTVIAYISPRS